MVSSLKKFIEKQKRKLPETTQLRFIRRLYRLLANGYPLLEALEVISWDKDLVTIADNFIAALREGKPLDTVFEENGFHKTICSFVYFTRANSDLTDSIYKCIELFEQNMNNQKKFRQILRYPLILLFIFSIAVFFIKTEVLPAFQLLLQTSNEAQDTISLLLFMMDVSQFVVLFSFVTFLIISCIWIFIKRKIAIDQQVKVLNRIPIYRYFLRLQTSFQFASHFSSLLKAGLSLKQILQELAAQHRLPILSFYAKLLTIDLSRGFHLSSQLSELPFIEKQLENIFQKNTDMKALEKDLSLYSDIILEELHRKVMNTITLIQPVFYIFLGIFIIFIYLSLMLPMFQLINSF